MSRIRTENSSQVSFCPYALREISVLAELTLGHLCYRLTDVPPQPNSPPDTVPSTGHPIVKQRDLLPEGAFHRRVIHYNQVSKTTSRVVVFHWRSLSHLCYTS